MRLIRYRSCEADRNSAKMRKTIMPKVPDNTFDLIFRCMYEPDENRPELTPSQEKLLVQVTDCYNRQLTSPMLSKKKLRDYLVKAYGITSPQAYQIIRFVRDNIGNVDAAHKNFIKHKIEYMLERACAAIEAREFRVADSLVRVSNAYCKAFRIDVDEGELIDAKQALDIETVRITSDPASIGIHIDVATRSQIEKEMKKYGLGEYSDYQEVTPNADEENLSSQGTAAV